MRDETKKQLIWFLVIVAWASGFAVSKWGSPPQVIKETGESISVPLSGDSWLPLVYFPLTVVASYVLSQLFFGGGVIFIFFRGSWDAEVFMRLETVAGGLSLFSLEPAQVWRIFYYLTILGCNLPLCLWAAQLGAYHSVKTLSRLRGELVKPSEETRRQMIALLAASIILAVPSSLALSHA